MTSQRTRLRMVERLRQQGIDDEPVLAVMSSVPRHAFVEEALMSRAYEDVSLPIGFGQTISQPYMVARMSSVLRERPTVQRVLEIGTGCGYQTALLAKLFKAVYSVERIQPLLVEARQRLLALGLRNIRLKHGDGQLGWPEAAPFDAIILTAAACQLPEPLMSQLAPHGRLLLPLGAQQQQLCCVDLTEEGRQQRYIQGVKFVPLLEGILK